MPRTGTPRSQSCSGGRGEPAIEHAGGAARKDDGAGGKLAERGGVHRLERPDFAIDVQLAHPARDQLRYLTAEVDDEQEVVAPGGIGSGHAARSMRAAEDWQAGRALAGGRAGALVGIGRRGSLSRGKGRKRHGARTRLVYRIG